MRGQLRGFVQVGSPHFHVIAERGPQRERLGPETGLLFGQFHGFVDRLHRPLAIAAGERLESGDQKVGIRFASLDFERFFKVGQGQLSHLGPTRRRGRTIEDLGAHNFGPLQQGASQQIFCKLGVGLVQTGFDRLMTEPDHASQVVDAFRR